MLSPMPVQRPDSSQSLARVAVVGSKNSWPMVSISSRTMRDDLVDGALAEEEVSVDSGAKLADVAGAQQQLVAGDFGVGGSFAQSGDEEFGPAVHACSLPFVRAGRDDAGYSVILSGAIAPRHPGETQERQRFAESLCVRYPTDFRA